MAVKGNRRGRKLLISITGFKVPVLIGVISFSPVWPPFESLASLSLQRTNQINCSHKPCSLATPSLISEFNKYINGAKFLINITKSNKQTIRNDDNEIRILIKNWRTNKNNPPGSTGWSNSHPCFNIHSTLQNMHQHFGPRCDPNSQSTSKFANQSANQSADSKPTQAQQGTSKCIEKLHDSYTTTIIPIYS